jgi:hypothetical protein
LFFSSSFFFLNKISSPLSSQGSGIEETLVPLHFLDQPFRESFSSSTCINSMEHEIKRYPTYHKTD